jgi:MFS family permease
MPGIRTFWIIWLGQVISAVGSGLAGFALSIWIYERTDSISLLSLNLLALALPGIIFSPLAGVLADRYNRRLESNPISLMERQHSLSTRLPVNQLSPMFPRKIRRGSNRIFLSIPYVQNRCDSL